MKIKLSEVAAIIPPNTVVGSQLSLAGPGDWLFPSPRTKEHYRSVKGIWRSVLRKAEIPYFRVYDLRSTYATRLSAGGVADEWVVQLLRQGNSDVFKKYSQVKLTMKREALEKLNRLANEMAVRTAQTAPIGFWYSFGTVKAKMRRNGFWNTRKCFKMSVVPAVGV